MLQPSLTIIETGRQVNYAGLNWLGLCCLTKNAYSLVNLDPDFTGNLSGIYHFKGRGNYTVDISWHQNFTHIENKLVGSNTNLNTPSWHDRFWCRGPFSVFSHVNQIVSTSTAQAHLTETEALASHCTAGFKCRLHGKRCSPSLPWTPNKLCIHVTDLLACKGIFSDHTREGMQAKAEEKNERNWHWHKRAKNFDWWRKDAALSLAALKAQRNPDCHCFGRQFNGPEQFLWCSGKKMAKGCGTD